MKYYMLGLRLILVFLALVESAFCLEEQAANTGAKNEKGQTRKVLPIVKVFNTSAKLWLYWQNYTDDVDLSEAFPAGMTVPSLDLTQKCTFIEKYNITDNDINYWWKTIVDSQMVQSHHYGQFFKGEGDQYGSMNVTDISGNETEPSSTMTLKYKNGKCYVFFVSSLGENNAAGCELYMRGKNTPGDPSKDCKQYYDDHCGSKTPVYENFCKRKVKEAQEDLNKIMN